ncbi:MAG: membrane protein insertion efficiency factor YidD [Candidatus Ancillula sp.]|jgi:putative membrane protein insertion efficiency factor|nr:membrane protein insertion efficiency factor YidD [Candidatus Ancillula sp.]
MKTLISLYQKFLSPLHLPCCKYYPTCSTYFLNAVTKYGYIKGSLKGLWRLLRCNPFSNGGIDEV